MDKEVRVYSVKQLGLTLYLPFGGWSLCVGDILYFDVTEVTYNGWSLSESGLILRKLWYNSNGRNDSQKKRHSTIIKDGEFDITSRWMFLPVSVVDPKFCTKSFSMDLRLSDVLDNYDFLEDISKGYNRDIILEEVLGV